MISERPKIKEDRRYNVTQTCQLLAITKDTLRKYTILGWIKHHIQMGTAKKYYLGADILNFYDASY